MPDVTRLLDAEGEIERAPHIKEKHLLFLDRLRESGETNMYGAAPWIEAAFGMSRERATKVLVYWMRTFALRHPEMVAKRKGQR